MTLKTRKNNKRRYKGGAYTFKIIHIIEGKNRKRYAVTEIPDESKEIKLYDYKRVINHQGRMNAWYDKKYNPKGKNELAKGGAFLRMHYYRVEQAKRKKSIKNKKTKKKKRRKNGGRRRRRKGGEPISKMVLSAVVRWSRLRRRKFRKQRNTRKK